MKGLKIVRETFPRKRPVEGKGPLSPPHVNLVHNILPKQTSFLDGTLQVHSCKKSEADVAPLCCEWKDWVGNGILGWY